MLRFEQTKRILAKKHATLCLQLIFFIFSIALSFCSSGITPGFPVDVLSVYAKDQKIVQNTFELCKIMKSGLQDQGLVFNFHIVLPRDQNDYTIFSTSQSPEAFTFVINEQRQIIFYAGQRSGGYELTDLGKDFYDEIAEQQISKSKRVLNDLIDVSIFFERTDTSTLGDISVVALGGNPSPSTVRKLIPSQLFVLADCTDISEIGVDTVRGSVDLNVGLTGRYPTLKGVRIVNFWRGLAATGTVFWMCSLGLSRFKKMKQSDYR